MDNKLKKGLVKNTSLNLVSSLINRIGALIFTIILARFLLPERFGLYTLALSIALFVISFADLGINTTLIRYISFSLKKQKKKINSYYRYLLRIKFYLILFFSLLLLILAYPLSLYVFKKQVLILPLLVASFYIFILSLENFFASLFYAIKKVKYVAIRESMLQFIRIGLALIVVYFITDPYKVTGIFAALILTSLLVLTFVYSSLRRLAPEIFEFSKEKIDKARLKKFIGFLTIGTLSALFFSYIDSIMLGIFLSSQYVGYYKSAISLITVLIAPLLALNVVLLPDLTQITKSKLKPIINHAFRFIFILTIPAIFGFFALGKYFIRILYGPAYLPAYLPLYFLAITIFPVVCVGLLVSLFSAREKPAIFAKLVSITVVLNIILNFILIKYLLKFSPIWATAGAAIATLASWTIYFVASIYLTKKELGISPSLSKAVKPLIASLIMFAALMYILNIITDMTIILGLVTIIFGAVIYFLAMLLMKGFNKTDLNIIKILFKSK